MKRTPSVAVVTGGHAYDVPAFHRLFRHYAGEMEVLIQHLDDFACSPPEVRQAYDAVVFYVMMMEGPMDEGQPWYAGRPKTALAQLGETPQGIVVLHHALLAYPQWPVWSRLVGIEERGFGYFIGETLRTEIADPDHPITRGLDPWTMVDETYTMAEAGPGNHVLLRCDHPKSTRTLAWTRQHGQARVFCYQAGHDDQTWSDASFREVLRRGILWSARRL